MLEVFVEGGHTVILCLEVSLWLMHWVVNVDV